MVHRSFPPASIDEINRLKDLIRATEPSLRAISNNVNNVNNVKHIEPQESPQTPPPAARSYKKSNNQNFIFDNVRSLEVKREPLNIDNPVQLLITLKPELTPYKWQFEELMRTAGYLSTGNYSCKTTIDDNHPFLYVLPAANGSGKDMVMIAAFAVWFMLTGTRNRVIITSSSQDQTKYQTEPSIRELCDRANQKWAPPGKKLISYVQFHYVCPELGSEIKLYATDEACRAEGYHPFFGGRMALIINEAKSVSKEIFDAVDRCTGYSYYMMISSPGRRSGPMYKAACNADYYPDTMALGHWYKRHITAYECPHIPRIHIETKIYERGIDDPWVQSSLMAAFSDYNEPVIVSEAAFDKCYNSIIIPCGNDIGIGVDFGGGGDENSCWVRKGNQIIFNYHFCQKDTTIAASLIDLQLSPWKQVEYTFNADNGGIGQAFIDNLKNNGWNVYRRNNQSPAFKKGEFLNLGAEMWFHNKRLIERCDIILPRNIAKFKEQLTTRYYKGMESTQGKLALESKAEARSNGHNSPDRADGYVLCNFSYRPNRVELPKDDKKVERAILPVSSDKLQEMFDNGLLRRKEDKQFNVPGRFSYIGTKI